jgi:hypothetical protein
MTSIGYNSISCTYGNIPKSTIFGGVGYVIYNSNLSPTNYSCSIYLMGQNSGVGTNVQITVTVGSQKITSNSVDATL